MDFEHFISALGLFVLAPAVVIGIVLITLYGG